MSVGIISVKKLVAAKLLSCEMKAKVTSIKIALSH